MALPSTGRLGQVVTYNGYNYRWTGVSWLNIGLASITITTAGTASNVSITGNAVTTGNTTVTGNAVTTGNTTVTTNGLTTGATSVTGNAVTTGNTTVTTDGLTTGTTSVTGNAVTTGSTALTDLGVTTGNATTGATSVTANSVVTGNSTASTTVTASGVTTGNATTGATSVTADAVVTGNATAATTVTASGLTTGNTTTGATTVTATAITTGNTTASTTVTSAGVTTGNTTTGATTVTANAVVTGNSTASTTVTALGVTTGDVDTGATSVTANSITTGNATASTTVTSAGVTTGNTATAATTVTATAITTGNTTTSTTVTATGVTTGNATTGATTVTANSITTGNTTTSTSVTASGVTTGNTQTGATSVTANTITTGNATTSTTITALGITTGNTAVTSTGLTTGNTTVTSSAVTVGNVIISTNSVATANLYLSGGAADNVLITDGFGNTTFVDAGTLPAIVSINATINSLSSNIGTVTANFKGNSIQLGTNMLGAFISNAVSLTETLDITDAIAELNFVLGKLVPPSPPNFPGTQSLSLASGTVSGLMCAFTQTDNSGWGNLSVAGSTVVNAVRSSTYATNSITNTGPGTNGTVTAYLNGQARGNVVLTGTNSNTTDGNLYVYNVQDYHAVVATVTAGFWTVFSAQATGTAPAGWNRVRLADSAAGTTNTVTWYYDASTPGTPTFSNTTIALTSNTVTYSSTVPHFTSATQFTIRGNVSALSGDTYPNSSTLVSGSSGGAFQAPATVSYAAAGVTTPLARNLYVSSGSAYFQTTVNVVGSGFGSSSTGPTVSVNNNYATRSVALSPGTTVLYKNGASTQIEEISIPVGAVGSGSGNAYRIVNPDAGAANSDYPAYTGSEAAFNSQNGQFYATDATVVASVLQHDRNNYSSGYLPVGPDLSTRGSGNAQYFTFKFVRSATSKFNIAYTGTIAGLWVSLPGVTDVGYATPTNGWLNMGVAYSGSGVPGTGTNGNGSVGCSTGGSAVFNSSVNASYTCTFGTESSSSPTSIGNEIYVRVKLTAGQILTALSIQAPTN